MKSTFLSLSSFRSATRAFLRVQHLGLQHFTRTVLPPFLQQLLLSTVVNTLSPVALFASSPSRCHSHCLYRSLGRGPLCTCRIFRVKAGLRRRLTHSFPYNHHGCMIHRPIGVTRGLVQVHPAPCQRASDL